MENILKHLKWTNNVNLPYIFLSRSLKKDKKMLLEKVDTFDKAMAVLLSEEQANIDSKQCANSSPDAATFATSAYKKQQNVERQNYDPAKNVEKGNPTIEYVCYRCLNPGHYVNKCRSLEQNCKACGKLGHTAKACGTKNWGSTPTVAQAHSVKAYLAEQSVNAKSLFNAQQIEKASACGLTYNIEAERCDNEESMTQYQKEFMATGSLG